MFCFITFFRHSGRARIWDACFADSSLQGLARDLFDRSAMLYLDCKSYIHRIKVQHLEIQLRPNVHVLLCSKHSKLLRLHAFSLICWFLQHGHLRCFSRPAQAQAPTTCVAESGDVKKPRSLAKRSASCLQSMQPPRSEDAKKKAPSLLPCSTHDI